MKVKAQLITYKENNKWEEYKNENKNGHKKKPPNGGLAGVAGFEPTAPGFGDQCSTTELYPFN